ncbi:tail fiber domain-containing protein, partial [Arenimonas sp.]|nr:tail fiber domain-containing protein [Candidatus Parcubacteria bacterium]
DTQALSFKTNGITRLTIDTSGNITATGTISATSFYGNGSNLTGIFSTSTSRGVFSASGPLVYSTSTGNFLINQSSSTSNGYLSSADFTNFQAKENAITASTTSTYFRGDKTFRTLDTSAVPENGNLYFTNARVNSLLSATTSLPNITTLSGLVSASNLNTLGTVTTGVWNATPIGDSYITKTGDWAGTFNSRTGLYYLSRANQTGTQLASTVLDFGTTTRGLLSSSATGLSYSTTTGIFSLTSGYTIPLVTSTTQWNTAFTLASIAVIQGGNSFGTTSILGTNDNNALQFKTNNVRTGYISADGLSVSFGANAGVNASMIKTFFVGNNAGLGANSANDSNFLGSSAGSGATAANNSNFLGLNAGYGATNAYFSNFFGQSAGNGATDANYSNFLGLNAGSGATAANNSNFFGVNAGYGATNAYNSNFLGYSAGYGAVNASSSNFIGLYAGYGTTNANRSNFLGQNAGNAATNASFSNFIGQGAGFGATNAANSTFIGLQSGLNDTVNNTSGNKYSILIGNYTSTAGFSNSIAIGQGVSNSAINQLNIGRVIYATNIGSSTTPTSSAFSPASVGIGMATPADRLQVFGDVRLGTTGTNGCIKDFSGTGITGTCSSDERLKTNIIDLSDNYLDKMAKLRVISYSWNDTAKELNKVDTTVTNYGLLAQNVEENFPELVSVDSNGYKQVNYSRIPLYLIKSIQELSKKVNTMFVWFKNDSLNIQNNVCVDDVCVTKEQFKQMLINGGNTQSNHPVTPINIAPILEPTPVPVILPTPEPVILPTPVVVEGSTPGIPVIEPVVVTPTE